MGKNADDAGERSHDAEVYLPDAEVRAQCVISRSHDVGGTYSDVLLLSLDVGAKASDGFGGEDVVEQTESDGSLRGDDAGAAETALKVLADALGETQSVRFPDLHIVDEHLYVGEPHLHDADVRLHVVEPRLQIESLFGTTLGFANDDKCQQRKPSRGGHFDVRHQPTRSR